MKLLQVYTPYFISIDPSRDRYDIPRTSAQDIIKFLIDDGEEWELRIENNKAYQLHPSVFFVLLGKCDPQMLMLLLTPESNMIHRSYLLDDVMNLPAKRVFNTGLLYSTMIMLWRIGAFDTDMPPYIENLNKFTQTEYLKYRGNMQWAMESINPELTVPKNMKATCLGLISMWNRYVENPTARISEIRYDIDQLALIHVDNMGNQDFREFLNSTTEKLIEKINNSYIEDSIMASHISRLMAKIYFHGN